MNAFMKSAQLNARTQLMLAVTSSDWFQDTSYAVLQFLLNCTDYTSDFSL